MLIQTNDAKEIEESALWPIWYPTVKTVGLIQLGTSGIWSVVQINSNLSKKVFILEVCQGCYSSPYH